MDEQLVPRDLGLRDLAQSVPLGLGERAGRDGQNDALLVAEVLLERGEHLVRGHARPVPVGLAAGRAPRGQARA